MGAFLPPDVNLFGDDYPHTVLFQDGSRLRGEIVAVGKDEILLRRPDASAPLRLARGDCERLEFFAADLPATSANTGFSVQSGLRQKNPPAEPLVTTVQLAGSDWLAGEVRSLDGEAFTVRAGNGARFTLPGEQIRWLYAGEEPAPSLNFNPGDSALKTSGWTGLGISAEGPFALAMMFVPGSDRIEHEVPKAERFEIAFEVPEDAEKGTQLWFQPRIGFRGADWPGDDCFGVRTDGAHSSWPW